MPSLTPVTRAEIKDLSCMNRKLIRCRLLVSRLLVLSAFGVAVSSPAQSSDPTNYVIPVVTIRATDPLASWTGDTATFSVFRDGSTNAALNVYYLIGGTASNGVDY